MQLNVEGLSAAKREVISSIAERQKIDVICLEETHVDLDKTNRFSIAGFDLLAYSLHDKHGRATYVRDNISDAHHVVIAHDNNNNVCPNLEWQYIWGGAFLQG